MNVFLSVHFSEILMILQTSSAILWALSVIPIFRMLAAIDCSRGLSAIRDMASPTSFCLASASMMSTAAPTSASARALWVVVDHVGGGDEYRRFAESLKLGY